MTLRYAFSLLFLCVCTAAPFGVPASLCGDELVPLSEAMTTEQLAAHARPSLVVVHSTDRTGGELGLGTGFVIEQTGLIATAWHVIGDGREIRVEFPDGRELAVTEVFASSSQLDLALLRVAEADLPILKLSDEDRSSQGAEIVAMGHPEGFRNSIVAGVVSGHQEIDGVEMIQLAMSIERGNSGGPVLNRQGEVVGVVTRKSALENKVGFAVPIRLLRDLLKDPNPVPMARWNTIGTLDPQVWTPIFGSGWRQRAGRILARGSGNSFGGRTLCLNQENLPEYPFDVQVQVRLDDEAGAAGLVFHSDGGDRHYGFYPSAGNLRLTRFDGPSVNSWTILHNEPHPEYRAGEWNTLTVRMLPDSFECYVNGAIVLRSSDNVIPPGMSGLASFRGTEADFRRFAVGGNLLPGLPSAEILRRLEAFADDSPWNQPVEKDRAAELLPLGETAVEFMSRQAAQLEQKAMQLRRLSVDLHQQAVRQQLIEEISGDSPDLMKSALLVARISNADVDVASYMSRLDRMAGELSARLSAGGTELERLQLLDEWFFNELGVRGSRIEYDTPSNSYLNEVIDDREGIPLSLSVFYMEMARRLQLNVVGVGLPGHFVTRFIPATEDGTEQTIDVFDRGNRLTEADVSRLILAAGFPDQQRFRAASTTAEIIERMLLNLLHPAERRRDDEAVLCCLESLVELQPENPDYRARRLEIRARTGRLRMAIRDADWFVDEQPAGVNLERVHALQQSLTEELKRREQLAESAVGRSEE